MDTNLSNARPCDSGTAGSMQWRYPAVEGCPNEANDLNLVRQLTTVSEYGGAMVACRLLSALPGTGAITCTKSSLG